MFNQHFYDYLVGLIDKIHICDDVVEYYDNFSSNTDVTSVDSAIRCYLKMCLDDYGESLWFWYENYGLFLTNLPQFKVNLYEEGLYISYDLLETISGNWHTMYDTFPRNIIVGFMEKGCKGG